MCYANGNILWKTTSLEESNIDKVCFTIDIVCGKRPCQSIDVSKSTYRNYRKLFYCTGNLDVQVLELFFLIETCCISKHSALCIILCTSRLLLLHLWFGPRDLFCFFFLSSCVVFAAGASLTFIKLLLYM